MCCQAREQRSGGAQGWPSALASPWRWRVELLAFSDERVIALTERGQPSGRQLRFPTCLRELNGDVQFDEQPGQAGGPRLASELSDPGQLPQVVGVAQAVQGLLVLG